MGVVIHATQLQTFDLCARMHKYQNIMRLEPKRRNVNLDLGTGIHEALAAYYRDGADPINTFNKWVDQFVEDHGTYEKFEEAVELGVQMLEGYVDWAVREDAQHFAAILAVEQRFSVPILHPTTNRDYGHRLEGTIDLLVMDFYGRYWIVDHKTASRFPSDIVLKVDTQFSAYTWAARMLFPDKPVAGLIYNGLRKQNPKTARTPCFKRQHLFKTDHELAEIQGRLYRKARAWKREEDFDASPGLHCGMRCAFTDLCTAENQGVPVDELIENLYTVKEQELFVDDPAYYE